MSELELDTRPYLEPTIPGQNVVLSAEAERVVEAWACTKAAVARYAHSPPEPVENAWIDHLHKCPQPLPSRFAWITMYRGKEPIVYEGRDITVEFPSVEHARTPHGVLSTMIAGYLAVKVVAATPSSESGLSEGVE